MKHVRIELHLKPKDVKVLDAIAKEQGRSRKNLCEMEILKLIQQSEKQKK